MATVNGDSKNAFHWNSVLYPVGTGLASGYALHKMDRAYFDMTDRYGVFSGALPQKLVQTAMEMPTPALKARVLVASPVLEEGVFRGLLRNNQITANESQHGKETLVDKTERVAVNSALFSSIHFDPTTSLKSNVRVAVPLFAAGVVFNGLMEATGSLLAPIAGHSFVNYLSMNHLRK
ncbi:MAG: CPBP family intramembrane metalloprotease [Chlamydiia bacterium]|nr:CPBP family intramembrane metalloprotease [Chlamydiia bacterium]